MNRTAYMSFLITATYNEVPIIAVLQSCSLEMAQQKAIAARLFKHVSLDQNPQAFDLLDATGDTKYNNETFLKAAKLVIESKIEFI